MDIITGEGCLCGGLVRGEDDDDESVGKGALRGCTGGFGRPPTTLDPVRESTVEKGGGAAVGVGGAGGDDVGGCG